MGGFPFRKGQFGAIFTTGIILLITSLALTGCFQSVPRDLAASGFSPTPESTIEPTPTSNPSPTPTLTPTPTPMPEPTATTEPTPTPLSPGDFFLDLDGPEFGSTVRTKIITISGITVPGTTVEVGDEVVRVELDGTFTTEVTLQAGQNVIEVTASGLHGGQQRDFIFVTYNPPPPPLFRLSVNEPPNLVVVADQPILVSGNTTVVQALVTVNGVRVPVDDEGNFSTTVRLTEGVNQIEVVALHPDEITTLRDTRSVTYSPP